MEQITPNLQIAERLITCAEYQHFIDDMRKHGKAHQPEHWNSFNFPVGLAQEPVLGVRLSDAIAYCEWITLRSNDGWICRLPTREEAESFPLPPKAKIALGYWLSGKKDAFNFIWIGEAPAGANILKLTEEHTRALNRDYELSGKLAQTLLNETYTEDSRMSILQTLINLSTLKERIAGISPAYEGIRTVKEKK